VDNIKTGSKERENGDMHWIHLVQNGDQWQALFDTIMNILVP
jgi:hypothetical protein